MRSAKELFLKNGWIISGVIAVAALVLGIIVALNYHNASSLTGGTLNDSRLSTNVSKYNDRLPDFLFAIKAPSFVGNLEGNVVGNVTGNLTGNASTATALQNTPTGCPSGYFANSINDRADLTCSNDGSNLINLNASDVNSGIIADSRLGADVTLQGNTFNGDNELLKLNSSGAIPTINGVNLIDLNASNITTGTLSNSRLESDVAFTDANNDFTGANTFSNAGNSFSGDGSNLTNLDASNISSGTLNDARLSSNVPLKDAHNYYSGDNVYGGKIVSLDKLVNVGKVINLNKVVDLGKVINLNKVVDLGKVINLNKVVDLGKVINLNKVVNVGKVINVGDSIYTSNSDLYDYGYVDLTNSSNQLTGSLDGNASTATQLQNTPSTCASGSGYAYGIDTYGNAQCSTDGSSLVNLDASNISSGTLSDSYLEPDVTTQGNTFNGASELVKLNASGNLPALNGNNLTNLNASNISSGTLSDSYLEPDVTTQGNTFNGANELLQLDGTGAIPTVNGVNLIDLDASNISSGTIGDNYLSDNVAKYNDASPSFDNGVTAPTFTGSLIGNASTATALAGTPAVCASGSFAYSIDDQANLTCSNDGSGLINLNASNISSGTLSDSYLEPDVTTQGNTFNGANELLQLDGTGAIPTVNGVNLIDLDASNISSGTIGDNYLSDNVAKYNDASPSFDNGVTAPTFTGSLIGNASTATALAGTPAVCASGSFAYSIDDQANLTCSNDGSGLINLNASNISSGTLSDSYLEPDVTTQGNTFNGANELLQLDGTGAIPTVNGVNLIDLDASNISSGTIGDNYLNSDVTTQGNTFNGDSELVQLNASGALPAVSGLHLTSVNAAELQGHEDTYYLNASNIDSGTLADTYLSSNVAKYDDTNPTFTNNVNAPNFVGDLSGNASTATALAGTPAVCSSGSFAYSIDDQANLTCSNDGSGLINVDAATLQGNNAAYFDDATNITTGTLSDTVLPGDVTLQGNTFNGDSQLVQLTAAGALPAVSGANLTDISLSQISGAGTIASQNANNVVITGGTIDGTAIGSSSPSTVSATDLSASGNVDFSGASNFIVPNTATVITSGTSACSTPGAIVFSTSDDNFYGCNGTDWISITP